MPNTWSPSCHSVTAGPTPVTTPDASVPGVNGSGHGGRRSGGMFAKPERAYQSGGLTPAAYTRTRTSRGPGSGSGTSSYSSTSGPPIRCTRIAFIARGLPRAAPAKHADRLVAGGGAELAEHVRDAVADGLRGEEQARGDLRGGQALGEQLQDLQVPRVQRRQRPGWRRGGRGRDHRGLRAAADHQAAARGRVDRGQHVVRIRV